MTVADFLILAVFLASMVLIGVVFARENDSVSEMFGAGGRSPWWVSGLSSYMTFFSAGAFVVWGGMAFRLGITAILINLCHGVAALLAGYFVAGRWKRLGVRTAAEFIELRFGATALQVYTWSMLGVRVVSSGVALYALAVMLTALMPLPEGYWFRDAASGHVSISFAIAIFGAIVIAYTMIGGLWAVLMTDVLQFVVILLTVLYTLVAIVVQGGGWSGALSAVPSAHLDPAQVTLPTIFFIGWTLLHFFQFGAEWAYAQRYLSVPTGPDARRGMYLFGVLYLISPIVFLAPPLIFRGIEPNANPEQAYMLAAALVLPSGMLGMVVAAMFSATASSVSAQLNLYAGVLTTDMYARVRGQPSSEQHLLWVGRAFTVLLGLIVIAVAIAIPHLGGAEAVVFALMGIIGPLFAPAVWGLLSPRIGNRALWSSLAVSLVVYMICEFGLTGPRWFGDAPSLASLSRWLVANPYTAEIYSAVVAPVAVLLLAEWWPGARQRVAEGWRLLEARAAALAARAEHPPTPSELPAKVVAAAFAFVAALTAALVPINLDNPTGLFIATSTLAALSLAVWLGTRPRGRTKNASWATAVARPEAGDGRD